MDGFERYLRDKIGKICDGLDMGNDRREKLLKVTPRFRISIN
jgi:hypothetical protein